MTELLIVRAPRLDDARQVVSLLDRCAVEQGDQGATVDEVRRWWTAPDFDLGWQALVALEGAAMLGYVDVGDPNGDGTQLWIDLRVPEAGRRQAGDALLLDTILERARSHVAAGGVFRGFATARDDHTLDLFRARGFQAVRHSIRMEACLGPPPPEPSWPAGIRVRTADPDRDVRRAYDAYREAFADAWGAVEEPYEDFLHGWGVGHDLDPSLWFLAEDGDHLAGVALCRPSRGAEIDLGWVSILGVRRSWRRRGLGRALLLHAFHALRLRGKLRVGLGVDADSPTGAVALYESVGMDVVNRFVSLEKPA